MVARNIRVTTSDFSNMRHDQAVYVDKTRLVYEMVHDDRAFFLARPRRFGKTLTANMLAAYYDKSCDSHALFDDLEIAKMVSYEKHLNKYNVV